MATPWRLAVLIFRCRYYLLYLIIQFYHTLGRLRQAYDLSGPHWILLRKRFEGA